MKFDFIIGNPPYQEESAGEKISDASLYANFMNAAYAISDRVELITPARFLFNNGNTPAAWNMKMLNDEHFKVLDYSADSSKFFSSVDIKGGVAIHYRDAAKNYGAIIHYTAFDELNSILKKVNALSNDSIMSIIYNQNYFNLMELYNDFPDLRSKISSNGRERRMTSGCIVFPCFRDEKQNDDVKILGYNKKRIYKYIKRMYIDETYGNLTKYKVIVPANNGSGAIGEVISTPLIGTPLIGYTQTFISFGCFETRDEAESCLKYIKTKFARTMLGVLKVTQNGKKPVWKYVPLQDFTAASDIDWSKSIPEIDRQLYAKYGLDDAEIEFIETHVKEMN